jgi:hypothetical protein
LRLICCRMGMRSGRCRNCWDTGCEDDNDLYSCFKSRWSRCLQSTCP